MEDKNKGKRYTWFGLRGVVKETPSNWITCTPVRLFGIVFGWRMKLARPGYAWGDGKVQGNQ